MNLARPFDALCRYDRRNPNYVEQDPAYGDASPPRAKDCGCDPCFYGRDRLALRVIALLDVADAARAYVEVTDARGGTFAVQFDAYRTLRAALARVEEAKS